jgi:hypothetical protein
MPCASLPIREHARSPRLATEIAQVAAAGVTTTAAIQP